VQTDWNRKLRTTVKETWSRDSSEVWYLTTGWIIGGPSPDRRWELSVHHRVQNGSGAHPASYPKGNRGSFLAVKAAGA